MGMGLRGLPASTAFCLAVLFAMAWWAMFCGHA